MSNSYRLRTQVGVDKSIKVLLDQDFEFLEILSLKITQSQIYTRQCSDYGVVIGRVTANQGFGLPNCKVSIFVPLSNEDENNPIITDLYPYKSVSDTNEDGYRYNLLPYTKSYSNHSPTGTFFEKEDILTNPSYIEVFDKYFKYTAVTNESGDFMIFGVPRGTQTLHIDIDLSDIGEFSLSPQDLIRMGRATDAQVAGTKFRSSTNLNELPQIVTINRIINVEPLWGQPEICNIGITRTDFDLTGEANITIQPTAIFMGSMFSNVDDLSLKKNCKPKFKQGELCSLIAGPGEILAIRQTTSLDNTGKPILEVFALEQGGQVIDDNGTWLIDVPMNLDYVITNEFGERIISDDPSLGIPTKGKYRFKVKWNQSPNLSENIKRAYFLVPNVREYGWAANGSTIISPTQRAKSYAFSLDWDDYADPQAAIDCEDPFYNMAFNKVYTISQLIDQYGKGTLPNRFISVKNILDPSCESDNNKFPTNDSSFKWDIIFLLFTFVMFIFRPILFALIYVLHVLMFVLYILKFLLPILSGYFIFLGVQQILLGIGLLAPIFPNPGGAVVAFVTSVGYFGLATITTIVWIQLLQLKLKGINLPIMLYDQCEFCECEDADTLKENYESDQLNEASQNNPIQVPTANPSGINLTPLSPGQYFAGSSDNTQLQLTSILSGQDLIYPSNNRIPTCTTRVPVVVEGTENNSSTSGIEDVIFFTSNITLAERINLFNTKAKYFDSNVGNPGGGVNRIKVSFEPTSVNSHYDNVVVMMCTPESASNIISGQMITFVNPLLSKDKNSFSGNTNIYGNNAISGTNLNNTTISVSYARFDGGGNFPPITYNIPTPNSEDTNFHKFPTDIEYFQVITGLTISEYFTKSSTQLPNSLYSRILNNDMRILRIETDRNTTWGRYQEVNENPMVALDNYEQNILLIMVRGVDPYSSRIPVRYELGRLFGYNSESQVGCVVIGDYKLNIPIQGGFKNVQHNTISTPLSNNTYSNTSLYYPTFNYVPTDFSGYSSNLIQYYSSLDNNTPFPSNVSPLPNTPINNRCYCSLSLNGQFSLDNSKGLRIGSRNEFGNEFALLNPTNNYQPYSFPQPYGSVYSTPYNTTQNSGGYFSNSNVLAQREIVEGGSFMGLNATLPNVRNGTTNPNSGYSWRYYSSYYSFKYPSGTTITFANNAPQRRLVMRSDRLPTSDVLQDNCKRSFVLQQNLNLGIYSIPNEGIFQMENQNLGTSSYSTGASDNETPSNFTNQLVQSINSCQDSVPLGCYDFVRLPSGGGEFRVNHGNCEEFLGQKIFDNGCYKLITTLFLSIPKDVALLGEWISRTNIIFGACRNVFSHHFTNNWINGTLYAFSFKNNRVFDENNQPFSEFCTETIYFDTPTNNFYYRSSPYYSGTSQYFVGRPITSLKFKNDRNLLFPTTIMDLGPRSNYIQEIVFSDEYDGYVVNNLQSSTFKNVSDILNIFIITRLANTPLIALITGGDGANIFKYFNRPRVTVDADYAQMISINSELGVDEFDADTYVEIQGSQDPVYFNGGNANDAIFGIFFSSDTQIRDYISPKRDIINPLATITQSNCAFNDFPIFSQRVPVYQWEIKQNEQGGVYDSIFGSQKNDWWTQGITTNEFFDFSYQSLDRVSISSRYFRTNSSPYLRDRRGYIYSVSATTSSPAFEYNPLPNSREPNTDKQNAITVGAPFYFYFGLKKGKSAWDRFVTKWVNTNTI